MNSEEGRAEAQRFFEAAERLLAVLERLTEMVDKLGLELRILAELRSGGGLP